MEPFAVICETCHARLKVRSESAIGEIHACPKCSSMVHIVPPLVSKKGGPSSPADEVASPSEAMVTSSAAAVSAEFALPDFDVAPVNVPAQSASVADAAGQLPATAAAAPATPTIWSPLLLAGVVGASMLVGGGITLAIWPSRDTAAVESAPPAATAPSPEVNHKEAPSHQAASVQVEDVATETDEANSQPPTSIAPEANKDVEEPAVVDVAQSAADDADSDRSSELALRALPPSEGETPTPDDEPNSPPDTAVPDKSAKTERDPILRFDPLDFDPSQLTLSTSTSPAASSSSASVPNDAAAEGGTDEADESNLLPAPEAANQTVTVRVGPVVVAAAEPHQVAHRLALPLDSLEVSDMPLAQFVEMLSDLAGMPMTLEPVALKLVGASAQSPVSATASDVTLEKLLRNTLTNHRLEFRERAGQVLVALPGAERKIAREYLLSDLVPAGDDATAIADLIETFVAPTMWRSGGGAGTIEVNGDKAGVDAEKRVHHELLIFCERLRLARGLPQKTRYPADRLSVESPYTKLATKLRAKTTFTLLPWTRLRDVVRHWEEAAGVTILVDWRSLADVQFGPSTPISCSAIDRPWDEALTEILTSLDLGWYAVDGETIAITSRDVVDHLECVEFLAVPQVLRDEFADDEALVEALRDEFLENGDVDRAAANSVTMELDGPSGRLIVRGTPAVHRYLTHRLINTAQ